MYLSILLLRSIYSVSDLMPSNILVGIFYHRTLNFTKNMFSNEIADYVVGSCCGSTGILDNHRVEQLLIISGVILKLN